MNNIRRPAQLNLNRSDLEELSKNALKLVDGISDNGLRYKEAVYGENSLISGIRLYQQAKNINYVALAYTREAYGELPNGCYVLYKGEGEQLLVDGLYNDPESTPTNDECVELLGLIN